MMRISKKARMNRLFRQGGCLDVAIDHGVCNEPSFLIGLEDMAGVVDKLVEAGPDAIQMAYGQADLLQARPERDKPALVMRIDMGNPYNSTRHRSMWSQLQNHDEPIIGALEMDAACVVVNLFMLPDEPELFRQCVENISRVRADCHRYGMPLMIEPLVMLPNDIRGGYQVDGDAEKIVTLVRLASEMGADIIKADPTSDPEDFHKVVEAARCPVLVRGGGREDLRVVLAKSAALMAQGANGMVYGRNIYQHDNPKAVVKALMAIIHQRASGDGDQGTGGVEALDQFAVVEDVAIARRVLQQRAEVGAGIADRGFVSDLNGDAQRLGTGAQHVEGLRMAMLGGEEGVAGLVLRQAFAEGHGFGSGGGFIQQGGVGDLHTGEVADQGLEVQQGLQAALGNLWLVRGVSGVPGRVFQQVAQDRARRVGAVVALADKGLELLVLAGDGLDLGQGVGFRQARLGAQHAGALDALGDDVIGQRVDAGVAEQFEHGSGIGVTRADMAGDKFVLGGQLGHHNLSGVSIGVEQALVGGLVEQVGYRAGIGRTETEEPTLAQGIFVDQLRAGF